MAELVELLRRLAETPGVAGFEEEMMLRTRAELEDAVDEVRIDNWGNVIGTKRGSDARAPSVMLAAHIDEPALIVKYIDDAGFIRPERQGFPHMLALSGERVLIHTGKGPVRGVVGLKGLHMFYLESSISASGKMEVPAMRDMYIDVGAESRAQVLEMGIDVGNPISLERGISFLGNPSYVTGKALDNRAPLAVMLEAMNRLSGEVLPSTIYAVGTVMEEIGHRGIIMSAYQLSPSILLAFDITVCGDTPDAHIADFPHRMGHGPTVKLMDVIMGATGLTAHPKIVRWLIDAAEAAGVPYQKEVIMGLNTDASTGHMQRGGIPAGAISIPCRYSHGPSEVVNLDDLENGVRLLVAALRSLPADFSLARV